MDPEIPLVQTRLAHEDDLINQRISWLVSSQSFLLTAYAITLNALAADSGRPQAAMQQRLLDLLPMAGIGSVILVGVAITGGLFAVSELRRFAATKYPKDRLFVICKPTIQFLGVSAPALIPIVFLVIWLWILRR